ncbi:mannose-6-phosphate isomerase-like protein (cupin superfamily) [Paenibacillus sp. V4I3]|uniref:cupin domain-containing protein n=1 Tax=unclassified Paenibacillus TaxID=185978 RepID=UPI00277F2A66|nr:MULTISPECIES: cupin domain-containing protein [unclassified Paenibacillus]MDQ0874424.1 mannose-6-phosphate isomerase-like protein (cupin superfamily) [Paenibacillus sp. V4I3]MDQ0889862.1 mannose-6-phosphate isomerase-like protein (cupin superfamily) [Paenibacillus sp. V4I9]
MTVRKINISEVSSDQTLKSEEGWVRMEVKWVCTEDTMGSQYTTFGHTIFGPGGGAHELHAHPNAEEILYVIRGHGIAISGDEQFEIGPGDLLFVPKGERHYFKNTHPTEEMETVWLYGGAPSLKKAGYVQVD